MSNKKEIFEFIKNELETKREDPRNTRLKEILQLFFDTEQLTLRELLKILNFDFNTFSIPEYLARGLRFSLYTKSLFFLSEIYTKNELISKIQKLDNVEIKEDYYFQNECLMLLASIGKDGSKLNDADRESFFKGKYYQLRTNASTNRSFLDVNILYISDSSLSHGNMPLENLQNDLKEITIEFTIKDFVQLLIENIKALDYSIEI